MSMVINLVEDHNIYLCEGGPVYNGGIQPTPITYLTQWKIVGNSEVHTDPYLTSWKVLGNSVVDNNIILSCGDLEQDGKYHVKISNGVTIYDIPLDAPLRKVNNIADTIEFPSSTEGKALVTRNLSSILIRNTTLMAGGTNTTGVNRILLGISNAKPTTYNSTVGNILCSSFETKAGAQTYNAYKGISVDTSGNIQIYDPDYNTASALNDFKSVYADTEVIYELATPTTELVDAPQIAVSPTDTYTSANVTPYSAFEHTENKEIWSCGEYNPIDGKYHILVQPLGGSIADIALTEPLRKVNDVADSIEFPSGTEGKALVTRNILSYLLENLRWFKHNTEDRYYTSVSNLNCVITTGYNTVPLILCNKYTTVSFTNRLKNDKQITAIKSSDDFMSVIDSDVTSGSDIQGEILLQLITPTTELIDAPQIEEAESYSMVISQGGKAVSWSSFETNSE